MAQPRQHHADLIAIRDFQLRLFMAQGLDEGHGQIGRANAVKETVVGGTWKISDVRCSGSPYGSRMKDHISNII